MFRRNFLHSLATSAIFALGIRLPRALDPAPTIDPDFLGSMDLDPLSRIYFNEMLRDIQRQMAFASLLHRETGAEVTIEISNKLHRPMDGARTIRIERWKG